MGLLEASSAGAEKKLTQRVMCGRTVITSQIWSSSSSSRPPAALDNSTPPRTGPAQGKRGLAIPPSARILITFPRMRISWLPSEQKHLPVKGRVGGRTSLPNWG